MTTTVRAEETMTTETKATVGPKHPYCQLCGWRKGGVDSWDGKRCKCGLHAPAFPIDVEPVAR